MAKSHEVLWTKRLTYGGIVVGAVAAPILYAITQFPLSEGIRLSFLLFEGGGMFTGGVVGNFIGDHIDHRRNISSNF